MSKIRNAVIFDLDGTISDLEHRRPMLSERPPRWDDFYEACHLDGFNSWAGELRRAMAAAGYKIIILSGRMATVKEKTEDWLDKHNFEYDALVMREAGNTEPDNALKKRFYQDLVKPYFNVLFVVDDRQKVVDMWRELGLVCLQCDKGNF